MSPTSTPDVLDTGLDDGNSSRAGAGVLALRQPWPHVDQRAPVDNRRQCGLRSSVQSVVGNLCVLGRLRLHHWIWRYVFVQAHVLYTNTAYHWTTLCVFQSDKHSVWFALIQSINCVSRWFNDITNTDQGEASKMLCEQLTWHCWRSTTSCDDTNSQNVSDSNKWRHSFRS